MKSSLEKADTEMDNLFNRIDEIVAQAAVSVKKLIQAQLKKIKQFPVFLTGMSDPNNPAWREITDLSRESRLETRRVVCQKPGILLKEEKLSRSHKFIILLPQGMFIFPAVKAYYKSGEIDTVPDWDNKAPCLDLDILRFGKVTIQKVMEEIKK